jgi:hypothetical protein
MTFTPHQIEALESLGGEFGPVDLMLHNVTSDEHVHSQYGYEHWIKRSLTETLRLWGQYKFAQTVDWEEERRRRIEEQTEKMKRRKVEVRENLVSGILSGLIPKARRAGAVSFEITDWMIQLVVREGLSSEEVFELSYDRTDFTLNGHLKVKDFEQEDWSVLGGNSRPRDQSVALNAVVEYLDGLADGV